MSETTFVWIVGGTMALLQGLLAYIFHTHCKRDEETRLRGDTHIEACNETPNKLILSKIVDLSASLDSKHTENRAALIESRREITALREKVSDQAGDIKVLRERLSLLK